MITIEYSKRRSYGEYAQIPVTGKRKEVQETSIAMKLIKITASALLLVVLASCSNSKVLIAPLYNRLDDQMRGEFHKLAKWDATQIEHFESRVGAFHVWHRQDELPKYASLLDNIQATIKVRDKTTQEDVNNWVNSAEGFSKVVRTCHPVNFSYDLMQTLTDEQVNFIEKRFASERSKNYTRYSASTPEERRTKRVNNVVKWASRIGFEFNNTQKRMLEETMEKQISLRREYYALVDQWAKELFVIARQQQASDYKQKMETQVSKLWTLLEKAHNKEWQANRDLWRGFGFKFVQSLSHDQRVYASNWIEKMADTVQAISEDEPSFKVTGNPQHGCAVGGSVNG